MESFHYYKGYGVRYKELNGTTLVEYVGIVVRKFYRKGSIDGNIQAEKYIDGIIKEKLDNE